jgi:TetR/AcrR family transcriptional regulator
LLKAAAKTRCNNQPENQLTEWINNIIVFNMLDNNAKSSLDAGPVSRGKARERLLEAAIQAFSTIGFDGVGPRHIAEAAGVNHSLVSYHFGSMDALWKEAVASLFGKYRDKLALRFEGLDGLDAETQLMIAIEDLVAFSRDNPMLHQIMTQEGRRMTPRLIWLVEQQLRPLHQWAVGVIRQGQAEGRVRAFDPSLIYYAMIALAATPFSIRAEFEAVTGLDPSAETTSRDIAAMIRFLVFNDREESRSPLA